MLRELVVFYFLTSTSLASDSTQDTSAFNHVGRTAKSTQGALGFYASLKNSPQAPLNVSFFEKDENPVRIPSKIYEEHKKKNKIKKSPKRTVQKIIKKGKNRSRKIYVNPITRQPTIPSVKTELLDSVYTQDEDVTTGSPRKRPRKISKIARYPMPFHKLQPRKDYTSHYRNRRQLERDDLYILKDLDEIEFLDRGKDYDVVRAHVQNYW